ncbi:MAG: exosortase system-associated protein, TIGR04073 family [Candidatus Omnitrophota bacterium]
MRRSFIVLTSVFLVFSFILPVFADGPGDKLRRGAVNFVLSPLEVPDGVWQYWQTGELSQFLPGATWGLGLGVFNCVKRFLAGVYEIVTFPIPIPKDYKPLINEPEFFG